MKGAFLDTSVLVRGLIDFGSPSKSSQSLLEAVAAGDIEKPGTAWHCCLEFYAVATRLPQEFRLTPADAMALLDAEVLGRFEVMDLPTGRRHGFLTACRREGVRGGRLYDAHIAEIARASGARLVISENVRHFASLEREGIHVRTADEALRDVRREH